MALDPSIFARFAPKSVADYDLENAQVQGAQQTNALNALKLQQGMRADQEAQRLLNEQTGVRNALGGIVAGPSDTQDQLDLRRVNALYNLGTQTGTAQADKLRTQMLEQQKTAAQAGEQRANSAKTLQGVVKSSLGYVYQNPTLEAANSAIDFAQQQTGLNLDKYRAEVASLQTPDQFKQWAAGHALDMEKQLPSFATSNTGQFTQTRAQHPVLGTAPVVSSVQNTASPGELLTAKTAAAAQAGENSRAAASRAIETVKVDPFGTLGLNKNAPGAGSGTGLSGDAYLTTLPPGVAAQVKAITEGKLQISPATIRTPQGQALLQMAMQYEPGTDQTTYESRHATTRDAASGKLATSNNALNTVAGHLAALADSADALDNTSYPWVNKIKNAVLSNSGDPRVKTFNMNMNGVVDELERAYRGAGGSEGSIKLWRENLGDANSPEQFRSVMAKGAEMLQSKLEANQAQYEQGMNGRPGDYSAITPKAAASLAKLRGTKAPPTATPSRPPLSSFGTP